MRALLTLALALGLTAAAGAQTFTVSGKFEYEDKGWSYNGWSGNFGMRPIRRADVFVLDDVSNTLLGSGSTDELGEFSLECTSAGTTDIVVRVDADTNLDPVFQRMRITTTNNSEYSAFSPVFAAHDTSLDLDVGTTSVLRTLAGADEGNPFNMLDMGVSGFDYIRGPLVNSGNVGTIRMNWPGGSGSFASGSTLTMAQDDGYDDAVILHELGHVVHNLYSDSDSPGGTHFFGDSDQDPRLSMGEGYATFFGGTVMVHELNRAGLYLDANGSSQVGGAQLRLRLEETTPYAGDAFGAADEVSVACTLFDILDDENSPDQNTGTDDDLLVSTTLIGSLNAHRAWWNAFIGPMDTAANLTLNDAWDGWFASNGVDGLAPEMEDLFREHRVHFFQDVDEPNNTINEPVPTTLTTAWSGDRTLYKSTANPPAPGQGDFDWWSAELVAGSRITIETRYPDGAGDANTQCDTFLDLWDELGVKHAEDEGSGTGRNARIEDFTVPFDGVWKWRVRTLSNVREYGRYNIRAFYLFENHAPTVDTGPDAVPSLIDDSQTAMLSATASDVDGGQTLTYTWTPQNGGTITGSGASVTFDPPTVASQTVFEVELVVTDNLGGASDPAIVQITVDPADACVTPAFAAAGGVGKPGLAGMPVLAPVGLPTVPGNGFSVQLTNALPSAQAWVFAGFDLVSAPFDGGTLYPSVFKILFLPTSGTGTLSLPVPFPDTSFCGVTFYAQVLIPGDPGASGFYQTSQSNYVEVTPGF